MAVHPLRASPNGEALFVHPDIAGTEIQGVSSIVNPDRLAHLGPIGDFNALLAHGLRAT